MPPIVRRSLPRLSVLVLGLFLTASVWAQTTAPVITAQPAGKTVNVGAAVALTVTATGTTPAYQWMFNGTPIAGATAAAYSIGAVAANQGGAYTVVVSNSAGSVTSSTATVLIYAPYVVRTLAGQVGVVGAGNGPGAAATFYHPSALASDVNGNIYIADTVNSVIRKMTPAGVVTTFAGQAGVTGATDGPGLSAQFNFPAGIAVDTAGNVYVADTFNSTIRKITPAGVVSTLAGIPPTAANPDPTNEGSTNGTGSAARFETPRGVAVDGAGNVYVADTQNNAIRKITPAGVVTTLAGNPGQNPTFTDGTGANARFNYPFGIASDQSGNLWVADTSNSIIRAITPAGVVTTLAGVGQNAGSSGGTGTVARFNQPTSIAVDSQGNLFVADENNSTVREILPGGVVVTVAGLAGNTGSADGSGTNARFSNPYGVTVDFNGNLYVADTLDSTIRVGSAQSPADVAPTILVQPVSQTVSTGASVALSVSASGTPAPTYQWQLNGVNRTGATASTLNLSPVQASDGGAYDVLVTNQDGTVTSSVVTLTVLSPPVVPAGSQSQSAAAGATVTLNSNAIGGNLTYQWFLNGVSIPGATAASLTISPVGTFAAGTYSVIVTNTLGSTSATIGTLTVSASARLLNLSASAPASSGANELAAGFVTSGGAKAILVRGDGPALAGFGLTGTLASPQLTLTTPSGSLIASSTAGWSSNASLTATLTQVFNQVGAFALASGSADQALLQTALAAGSYSAHVTGAGTTSGLAMAEIYDADTGSPAARLINLSAKANVGTGTNILTGGFVVSGTTAESVLLRGIGPTLATFGITGVLAKPVLTLYNSSGTAMATNSSWGGSAALATIFTAVNAFALPTASSDAAIVTALPPGRYTVQVSGAGNSTGIALVEIYEIPAH